MVRACNAVLREPAEFRRTRAHGFLSGMSWDRTWSRTASLLDAATSPVVPHPSQTPRPLRRLKPRRGGVKRMRRDFHQGLLGFARTPLRVRYDAHPAPHQAGWPRAGALRARSAAGRPLRAEPAGAPPHPNSHLRWHPLRGEWVAYAGHRQNRTFLPPPEYNPLAPTTDPAAPDRSAGGPWDVAVFENLFPTLTLAGARSARARSCRHAARHGALRGRGVHAGPDVVARDGCRSWHLELLVDVWADRYAELGARADVAVRVPVREPRRRGRRDAAPPARADLRLSVRAAACRRASSTQQRRTSSATAAGCSRTCRARRWRDGRRVIYRGPHVVAFVPVCARYPYEVWVAPHAAGAVAARTSTPSERRDFARALKTVLLKYDALWQRPFPYIMAFHQAPTDGRPHPEAHVHVEFYPAYRMPRPAEVSGRQRDRRRRVHGRHAARGQGARAAGRRGRHA